LGIAAVLASRATAARSSRTNSFIRARTDSLEAQERVGSSDAGDHEDKESKNESFELGHF